MKVLARWCYLQRRIVIALWVAITVFLVVIGQLAGATYATKLSLPNTESQRAVDVLNAGAPGLTTDTVNIVFHARMATLDDPVLQSSILGKLANLRTLPHVARVGDFYQLGIDRISEDRRTAYVVVQFDVPSSDVPVDAVEALITTARSLNSDQLQVELSGDAINLATSGVEGNINEVIGVVVAAIVLFVAFGSVYTMFLPLVTALLGLGIGFSLVGFLTHFITIATFGPTLAALIGLGVGIDYALFIVSRYRSYLQSGLSPEAAAVAAVDTSGRAVVFAGTTVCIGILGLLLLGVSFLYGLALAVVVVVLMTMLASVTALPAMLGFVGRKALSGKQHRALAKGQVQQLTPQTSGWRRWAAVIQRHSFGLGTAALLAMLILSLPVLSIRLGATDAGSDSPDKTTRRAYDLIAQGFGVGANGPLVLVAESVGGSTSDLTQILTQIKSHPDVASVTPAIAAPSGSVAIAQVYSRFSPQAEETTRLVDDIRTAITHPYNDTHATKVYLGGSVPTLRDFTEVITNKLPVFFGVVLSLSFFLLLVVFRSLFVPLVATVMNGLSTAASFGVVVAIFQWGWGAEFFGVQQTGPIQAFLPVIAFAILFGLSMDYEVFLVSRMYEEWRASANNARAITIGLADTGRVITAAAVIMVVIFLSFVFGADPTIKLFAISLATAVFLDAFVIRTVLVPAVMHQLGAANWYLPAVLNRLLPNINMESSRPVAAGAKPPLLSK